MSDSRVAAAPAARRAGPAAVPPVVTLRAEDGAVAEVHRHGAHVTSWRPMGEADDRLYLSARSGFDGAAAIRGGVPVIFPQFAAEGPLPRHGFARTSLWSLGCIAREADGTAEAEFVLRDSAVTREIWDAAFKAVLAVAVVARQLTITLRVENVGEQAFSFTAALHTYLRVHDVREAEIHGLRGTLYRVSGDRTLVADDADRLLLPDYVDRVYVGAPSPLELRERERTLTPREHEVMGLVVTGMLNKQIAYDLGTSEKTIKVHRARVMEKMRASSVAALVRLVDRLAREGERQHHGVAGT